MGLFARLFHLPANSGQDNPVLEQALERTARVIDPNLRRTRHWPGRYRASIGRALEQAQRVAQGVPGPVMLDRENWVKDPFVHTLFASAEEMQSAVSASSTIREFVAAHGGKEVHALLSLRREEKHSFGIESSGDVLRRDVAQRTIWFTDPHFIGPATSEGEARENLLWALFDLFLDRLGEGRERLRMERERLVQEKDLAQARLRGAPQARRPALEKSLAEFIKRLTEIGESLDPERMYEVFDIILSHPEDCLYLESHSLTLNALGVVRSESEDADVNTLHFLDLLERYQPRRTLVLVCCRNVMPSTLADRLDEAGHWL
jgi:hypothetical protein